MVATDYCTASRYKGLWANPLKEPQPCNQSQRTMSHHHHLHCVIPANPHLDESWAQFPGTSLCGRIEMTRPRHLVAFLSLWRHTLILWRKPINGALDRFGWTTQRRIAYFNSICYWWTQLSGHGWTLKSNWWGGFERWLKWFWRLIDMEPDSER